MKFKPTWILAIVIFVVGVSRIDAARSKHLVHVTEENWRDILQGEWMIEFHAPWCPACKDLVKSWNSFAEWSKDLSVNVGEIDVTSNTGLSGRFLVTALPTIYHVKDGVFRSYSGPRDKDDLISFIEEKKWTIIEPMPNWKHPDSFQMGVVSWFFKASMTARDLHNYLTEKQGLPSWVSYSIFGLATLVLGCILGFLVLCIVCTFQFIVCIIDWVFPATPTASAAKKQPESKKQKESPKSKKQQQQEKKAQEAKSKKEEEKLSDVDDNSSQASEHDSQTSQSEGEESNVRQRKPEKQEKQEKKQPVQNGKSNDASPKKKK